MNRKRQEFYRTGKRAAAAALSVIMLSLAVSTGIAMHASEPGDINGDGSINAKDLTRLMKNVSGASSDVEKDILDVTGDGVVNSKDLIRLMKYIAGEDVVLHGPKIDSTDSSDRVNGTETATDSLAMTDKVTDRVPDVSETRDDHGEQTSQIMTGYESEKPIDTEYIPEEPPIRETLGLYVDIAAPSGGDGSESLPFDSIEAARDRIRVMKAENSIPENTDIVVYIKSGKYLRKEPLTFTSEDSGTADYSITYKAYGDGDVVITGGVTLSPDKFGGADEKVLGSLSGDALKAVRTYDLKTEGIDYTSEKFGLYINGTRGTLARYPNDDSIWGFEGVSNNGGTWTFDDPDGVVGTWKNLDGVTVEGHFHIDWVQDSGIITGYDYNNGRVIMSSSAENLTGNGTYYFSNIFDELDSAGEYYVDRETGILYVYPIGNIEDCEIVIPVCDDAVLSADVSYYTFDSIIFEYGLYDIIHMNGDCNSIENCIVRNAVKNGIVANGSKTYIYNNEVYTIGSTGVNVTGGDPYTLKHSGNVVDNNEIHDFGQIDKTYNPGVTAGGIGCTVTHNEIYNAPHNAINYTASSMYIAYNYIHDVCREANDAGAVYDGGWRGGQMIFEHNVIKDITSPNGRPNGYYCDDGGAGKTVVSNMFINVAGRGLMIGGGRDNTITDNILINSGFYYDERCYYRNYNNNPNAGWASQGSHVTFPTGSLWKDLLAAEAYGSEVWAMSYPWTVLINGSAVVHPEAKYTSNSFGNSSVRQNIIFPRTRSMEIQPDTGRLVDFRDNIYLSNQNYFGFADINAGDYTVSSDATIYTMLPGFKACDFANVGRIK